MPFFVVVSYRAGCSFEGGANVIAIRISGGGSRTTRDEKSRLVSQTAFQNSPKISANYAEVKMRIADDVKPGRLSPHDPLPFAARELIHAPTRF